MALAATYPVDYQKLYENALGTVQNKYHTEPNGSFFMPQKGDD